MAGCTTVTSFLPPHLPYGVERDSPPYLCCLKKRVVICLPFSALSTIHARRLKDDHGSPEPWGGVKAVMDIVVDQAPPLVTIG